MSNLEFAVLRMVVKNSRKDVNFWCPTIRSFSTIWKLHQITVYAHTMAAQGCTRGSWGMNQIWQRRPQSSGGAVKHEGEKTSNIADERYGDNNCHCSSTRPRLPRSLPRHNAGPSKHSACNMEVRRASRRAGWPKVVTNRRGIVREGTGCPAGWLFSPQNTGKLQVMVAIGAKKKMTQRRSRVGMDWHKLNIFSSILCERESKLHTY